MRTEPTSTAGLAPSRPLLCVLAGAAALSLCWGAIAVAGEGEGERPRARELTLGSDVTGRLDPPEDSADWRYLPVQTRRRVAIVVESEGGEPESATVVVESAPGDRLDRGDLAAGPVRFERVLDPGIYYVRIGADGALRYRLTVRSQTSPDEETSDADSE